MSNNRVKKIKSKAENIIASEIKKNSENVTTIANNPTPKYEAPDNLKPDSTILED
ncbi:hypothetical protein [Clostridium omnivorum]|uniref:Uncharacterized protein n=1 Tax=Clostridium omnivorum TaxID=1604902 RepID=A0ABQ5NBW2_9CLOT|nr:hypothetical protein [Clostridium sp. E14]GLC32774.1 hypothetical protein bsdE14_41840 [Clostridium sp. E14]